MTYQGSKETLADIIVPFLEALRRPGQIYWEPFMGSASILERMQGRKIGSDIMESLVLLWNALIQESFIEPATVTKEEYKEYMQSEEASAMQAYVGFFWSFSGMYNKGYNPQAYSKSLSFSKTLTRASRLRQAGKDLLLLPGSYDEVGNRLGLTEALIYCDPPYAGTTTYRGTAAFDHKKFYNWCHEMKSKGHRVVVSEYDMPASEGFFCCLEVPHKKNQHRNIRETRTEKLFTL